LYRRIPGGSIELITMGSQIAEGPAGLGAPDEERPAPRAR